MSTNTLGAVPCTCLIYLFISPTIFLFDFLNPPLILFGGNTAGRLFDAMMLGLDP